jgi:hypothetical protein
VVVETAVTAAHGAKSGNVFSCGEPHALRGSFFARMFCQIAAQLSEDADPAATRMWKVGLYGLSI